MNIIQKNIILTEILEDDLDIGKIVLTSIECLMKKKVVIEPERISPVRNENYYENVLSNYTLDDFKAHFRMTRGTFEVLLNLLQVNANRGDVIPFEKKILFTIWMISKQESFIAAGDRFDFAKSTAYKVYFEIVTLIANLRQTIIVWPDENERRRISRNTENKSDIPGVIGAIDGCHIPIKAPPHNSIDYYNRNNYHSVILQAVCNDRREFIDIFVVIPGRVHGARVFRRSTLYTALMNDAAYIHESEHLLGDAAYPLLLFLLKPYRNNGHLTIRQTRFNTRMSSVRSLIEQTFGLLKCKFRRLKFLEMSRIDLIPTVIAAACVLHNIIIRNDGIIEELELGQEDNPEQVENAVEIEEIILLKENVITLLLF